MPKNAPIPVPDAGAALQWLMANPQAAQAAVQSLNLLLALQVRFTKAGTSVMNQQKSLLVSDEVIQMPLPILWPAGVPAAVDTGTVTLAQLAAVVNQITAGERAWQTLP